MSDKKEILKAIFERYSEEGPAKIAEEFGVARNYVVKLAYKNSIKRGLSSKLQLILEDIQATYPENGPKFIAEKFGVSEAYISGLAFQYGIKKESPRNPRQEEIDRYIINFYSDEGAKAVATALGITSDSAKARARFLGVKYDFSRQKKVKQEILDFIRLTYRDEGPRPAAEKFGLTENAVRVRAERAGIRRDNWKRSEDAVRTREKYDTLDLSIWYPELTDIGAYYLGLAWADSNVCYKSPDEATDRQSGYFVRFCHSGDDRILVDKLAEILHLPPERVRAVKKYKESHKIPYALKLCGKRVSDLFLSYYKIPMRKSTIDPPFPKNIPDEKLAAFSCGVFDGDGFVGGGRYNPHPYYAFCGSLTFLRELRCRLERVVGIEIRPIRKHSKSEYLYVFGVYSTTGAGHLTHFLHQYYSKPGVPYLRRKHDKFKHHLSPENSNIQVGEFPHEITQESFPP